MQSALRARPVARISLAVFLQIKCKPLASHSKRVSNSHPNRILEGRKCFPRGTTSTLGASKIKPKSSRGLPGAPKSAQEPPKSAQERPKSTPRAPQEPPKSAQERPKSAQKRPKSRSRASGHAQDRLPGIILRRRSSKKATFKGDLSRDSVEKRVRNDFR